METLSKMLWKLRNRKEPRSEETEVEEPKPMGWLDEMEPQDMVQAEPEETLKSRKAVSPVIATVVLVAVTITIAVAVAYWMSGISSQYTSFEKVEIQSGICIKMTDATSSEDYWNITLKLKNTGTAPATLIGAFVNEIEVTTYGVIGAFDPEGAYNGTAVTRMLEGVTIESGAIGIVCVYIDCDDYLFLSSGTTVNVKIHSAGGMDYIKLVKLT